MKYRFLIFILLILTVAHGQGLIQGVVVDKITRQPLAFANVEFKNTAMQLICDIDGKFSFKSDSGSLILRCSYIGYQTQEYKVDKKEVRFIIEMELEQNNLNEVIVSAKNNPADEIIRRVIFHKEQNNPEHLKSFKYKSYNKLVYDYKSQNKTDSISIRQKLKGSHFFMMESITERKFLKPNSSQEIVIATKVSGFKNPSFATIATDFQPFSFYSDNIKFFDINYLNPIAKGSLLKYNFRIEETLINKIDTTYIISFKPKKNKNFDGLKGLLYINSKKYAVQNVIASPAEKGKIGIKIQQKYTLVDNEFWFPEQLNFVIQFNEFPSEKTPMIIDGKTYLSEISINTLEKEEKFSFQTVKLAEDAVKDSIYWQKHRIQDLDEIDKNTYRVLDSIGNKKKFDRYLTLAEKLMQRKYPLNYVDIDLEKTLIFNKYEGFRLGIGLVTNEGISKKISLGGFIGYGLKDEELKYGGNLAYMLSKKNEFKIGFQYQNNLIETGKYIANPSSNSIFNFRDFIGYRYDQIKQFGVAAHFRSFNYLLWDIKWERATTIPKYDYVFDDNTQTIKSYVNSSITVNLKLAYKERFVNSFNQNISTGSNYPVFYVDFSKGFKNFCEANFNYNKIQLALEQSFFTKNIGLTRYKAEAGYIDKALPYGLLFTGEGTRDKDLWFIVNNTFQTMKPYEFLSDRYVNLFLTHSFGGLLFKKHKFQPNVILHQNLSCGDLSNQSFHKLADFKVKNKLFMESGLQLDNLIKLNYYNLVDIGLGTAAFYRYGYYGYARFDDNVSFKFTLSISIK